MTTFSFNVVLSGPMPDLDVTDRLFGRCPDAGMFTSQGCSRVEFDREAASLEEAVRSAVADVRAVGLTAERVELDVDDLAIA